MDRDIFINNEGVLVVVVGEAVVAVIGSGGSMGVVRSGAELEISKRNNNFFTTIRLALRFTLQ